MPCRNDFRPWSDDDLDLLARLYPDDTNATLARIFGRSEASIKNQAIKLGVRKSEAHKARHSAAFKPGQRPWNKGMKGIDIGGKHTRFQKRQKPHSYAPVGSERVNSDGYLQRKVTDIGYPPRDWRMVHHLVWEAHTGQPVPPGHALVFRDGDKANTAIDNLELVSRSDLMRRNTYLRFPAELRQVVQLKGALNRMINNRSHPHEDKCQ
ncbi:HNH endonuclease [Halomonas shengliensis]|uniref:HNH endonuclease n=1 Tax=Halomonas shengliensis TaxID=419597 RepID=A0A1H0LTB7_9GAMM|nr:HNH endonuclease signature motif containing protein [Halomonas shengliensis]SDO71281.1 HNH endonuclease [Halomonas shengliensis]